MSSDYGGKVSVEFVLNVLRQHEIELNRTSLELDCLVDKLERLTYKIQNLIEQSYDVQLATEKPISNTKPS